MLKNISVLLNMKFAILFQIIICMLSTNISIGQGSIDEINDTRYYQNSKLSFLNKTGIFKLTLPG